MPKQSILIVDDNEDIRNLIKSTLGTEFYNLHFAENGQEMLDFLQAHDYPDLVIMDMAMPVMSGKEALEIMKNTPDTHAIEVIILSAQATDRDARELKQIGARAVISKPFGPLELLRLVDEIIG